jgi:molecular chaperone DnaK (HSP70)
MLADIGGGTTDIAIFRDGSIWHTAILPVAGYQLTRDIAIGLGLPFDVAEEMKKKNESYDDELLKEMQEEFANNKHIDFSSEKLDSKLQEVQPDPSVVLHEHEGTPRSYMVFNNLKNIIMDSPITIRYTSYPIAQMMKRTGKPETRKPMA